MLDLRETPDLREILDLRDPWENLALLDLEDLMVNREKKEQITSSPKWTVLMNRDNLVMMEKREILDPRENLDPREILDPRETREKLEILDLGV